jgi:hypothetical protein
MENSNEKSKCCGGTKISCLYFHTKPVCENRFHCSVCFNPFEPQSIPLDRDERKCNDCFHGLCKVCNCCHNPDCEFANKHPMKACYDQLLPPTLTPESTEMGNKLRGEIEKVLWKHYDPDSAMNAEEIMDDIMPILSSHSQKLVSELKDALEKDSFEQSSTTLYERIINIINNIKI